MDKIAKEYNLSKNTLIEKALTSNAEILKGQTTAEAQIKAAKLRSEGTLGAAKITAGKETDFVKLANAKAALAADPTNQTLQKQVTAMEESAKLMKNQPAETAAQSKANIAIDKAVQAAMDTMEYKNAYRRGNKEKMKEIEENARRIASENLNYASTHETGDTGAPKLVPAPTQAPAVQKPPNIANIQGAPAGATVGKLTANGWEVFDKAGKLLGYYVKTK